ncbi:MAG: efflux RND transporter periplasmic adaptor subunit [Planctomycetia bacterium]|nr:efflux RND transporter periplasmic adaptor subunit [Planctomycetia bacterium]
MLLLPILAFLTCLVLATGCRKAPPAAVAPVRDVPTVRLVKPETRDLVRTVGQPSFIDSYEQTAIYAKLASYVLKWNVDIGDRLKKDDLLATLYIPELEQEYNVKKAQVTMDQALIDQADKLVEVADANVKAAVAKVAEAKADVGKFEALVHRWDSEVGRQVSMVADRVLDRQILGESRRQLESSRASKDAADAAVATAEANQLARQADLDKAKVDVEVAQARLKVASADEQRLAALYSYTRLTAPYPSIVVLRNINTGDFLLPATGDPSAAPTSADQSTGKASPVYVLARTDIVRIYVDVPESEANYIVSQVDHKAGDTRPVTKATVRVPAFQNDDMPAEVTRSSWALNMRSRTLRAEIDLANPDARLLPGMYAYGMVVIERPGVRALPQATLAELGNQSICYTYADGKAVKTPVQTGLRADGWVEVLRKMVAGSWVDFTGDEQVIQCDLSELADGQAVAVAPK